MCYSALVKQDLKMLETRFGTAIVRDAFEEYYQLSAQDSRTYKPLAENPRIYPLYFAPILYSDHGQLKIEPMRYQAWPPEHKEDPKKLTLYNARRDNLRSNFWSSMYLVHHGFLVMEAFYEWVAVKDLLKAGQVTEAHIKQMFAEQSEQRKAKILAQGKRYQLTKTEQTPLIQRKAIIQFKPNTHDLLLTPVIFAIKRLSNGRVLKSFAIITDVPTPEIAAAGHDRRPLHLTEDAIRSFIQVDHLSHETAQELLDRTADCTYTHELAVS